MSAKRKSIWIGDDAHHIAKVIGVLENKTIGEVLESALNEYAARNHPAISQGSMFLEDDRQGRAIAAFQTGRKPS